MSSSTTIQIAEDTPVRSTEPRTKPRIGDIVLVRLDPETVRPLIVTVSDYYGVLSNPVCMEWRVSGTICCEPEDHSRAAFRGGGELLKDPARIHGHPDRLLPLGYGELLREGDGIAQWRIR